MSMGLKRAQREVVIRGMGLNLLVVDMKDEMQMLSAARPEAQRRALVKVSCHSLPNTNGR